MRSPELGQRTRGNCVPLDSESGNRNEQKIEFEDSRQSNNEQKKSNIDLGIINF